MLKKQRQILKLFFYILNIVSLSAAVDIALRLPLFTAAMHLCRL